MTKTKDFKILENIHLAHGLAIDLDEGWKKLISSQFGGNPGRGFSELIQNLLDSYPPDVPWEKRRGEIETAANSISITDYGEGMALERIELLTTLGGTDKKDDPSKIGKFGLGFFAIFNPKLGTKEVKVTTCCEGQSVELVFIVNASEKKPNISARILNDKIPYSTRIKVKFNKGFSVKRCMEAAVKNLKYYPCRISVDGKLFSSVWNDAEQSDAYLFSKGHCSGFIKKTAWGQRVNVLCRYEHIMGTGLSHLITGGQNVKDDLRDYHLREVPYVKGFAAVINCNNLDVTIGRDSFYMNRAYETMIEVLSHGLMRQLNQILVERANVSLILANQYIMRNKIKHYLKLKEDQNHDRIEDLERTVVRELAEAKVYRISGRKGFFSLEDLKDMLSSDTPLFFSPLQTGLRWLAGTFIHDFIVLPSICNLHGGAPGFYDAIFGAVFDDVVNLDTVKEDTERIKKLVDRGIVDESALHPNCEIIGEREFTSAEQNILNEIDRMLENEEVRHAIVKHLHINVKKIQTVFFTVAEEGATIATGLFDQNGNALQDTVYNNFGSHNPGEGIPDPKDYNEILLGLNREHPLIQHVMDSDDSFKAYYMLTYLAHQLALCQRLLVPYSPFYHLVKERLASDMRKALMNQLLSRDKAV